jgi:hypothetical protein
VDLLEITQCKRDFDFQPVKRAQDSLPAIAWNGYLLTGFHKTTGTALNLQNPLPELIKDCYPSLPFPELCRLLRRLESHPTLYNEYKAHILAAYHLKDHPEMDELMGLVLALPTDYQNWISEKNLVPKELYPLRVVFRQKPNTAGDFISRVLTFLKEKKSTRAQISKAIEIASDLFLMGREPFSPCATTEIWLRYLESTRYPQVKNFDKKQQERILKLPWPARVQARWVRDGDLGGIEVTFSVHNPKELQATLEGLESLSGHLEEDLWKNH